MPKTKTIEELEEKPEKLEYATLPSVALLDREIRLKAIGMLSELDTLRNRKRELVEREEDLKTQLANIQAAAGLCGLRFGDLCFVEQLVKGRKTLDKNLLVENGCPADVIDISYKTGKPSARRTFKRLSEIEDD